MPASAAFPSPFPHVWSQLNIQNQLIQANQYCFYVGTVTPNGKYFWYATPNKPFEVKMKKMQIKCIGNWYVDGYYFKEHVVLFLSP